MSPCPRIHRILFPPGRHRTTTKTKPRTVQPHLQNTHRRQKHAFTSRLQRVSSPSRLIVSRHCTVQARYATRTSSKNMPTSHPVLSATDLALAARQGTAYTASMISLQCACKSEALLLSESPLMSARIPSDTRRQPRVWFAHATTLSYRRIYIGRNGTLRSQPLPQTERPHTARTLSLSN